MTTVQLNDVLLIPCYLSCV